MGKMSDHVSPALRELSIHSQGSHDSLKRRIVRDRGRNSSRDHWSTYNNIFIPILTDRGIDRGLGIHDDHTSLNIDYRILLIVFDLPGRQSQGIDGGEEFCSLVVVFGWLIERCRQHLRGAVGRSHGDQAVDGPGFEGLDDTGA